MSKYINYVPKPLQQDFINNNVIPIVGAGFSKNCDMPYGVTMPDWKELGKVVSEHISDYDYSNPIDAFSIYENEFSRTKLIELLSNELHINEIKPSKTYEAFCNVFFDTICTTNFDFLLDETLQNINRPYSIVTNEEKLAINLKDTTKLIKIHGDFNTPSNMVITEKDYDLFLSNNKLLSTYLSNLFITKTMFLVGYSFDDNDIRNIWQIINERLGNLKRYAYCVLVGASKNEIAKFERRNIKVINLPGEKKHYSKILEDFFIELKELISTKNEGYLISNNNRIREELIIPASRNKLCYVAAPYHILSELKEFVFPSLNDISITPIMLDDILYPGDNWLEKSELVIKKSRFAIVDISEINANVDWELRMLIKNEKNIIFICKNSYKNNINSLYEKKIIFYKDLYSESFIRELTSAFREFIYSDIPLLNQMSEAQRLIEEKDYTMSAIYSFRELEDFISKSGIFDLTYRLSLRNMLYKLLGKGIIHESESEINYCLYNRNKIVHTNQTISKLTATRILSFAQRIMDDIDYYNEC